MLRSLLFTSLLVAGTAACNDDVLDPDPLDQTAITFEATASDYSRGATVTLRVTNRSTAELSTNECSWQLQRLTTAGWTDADDARVCNAVARRIEPGATVSFERALPADARDGWHRFAGRFGCPDVASSECVGASTIFRITD